MFATFLHDRGRFVSVRRVQVQVAIAIIQCRATAALLGLSCSLLLDHSCDNVTLVGWARNYNSLGIADSYGDSSVVVISAPGTPGCLLYHVSTDGSMSHFGTADILSMSIGDADNEQSKGCFSSFKRGSQPVHTVTASFWYLKNCATIRSSAEKIQDTTETTRCDTHYRR